MKDWSKIKAWYNRKDDPAYVARVWAEGQTRYIIQNTLMMGLVMMFIYDFFGDLSIRIVVSAHLTGAFIAWTGWEDIENRYQTALNEARKKAIVTPAKTNLLGLRDS